MTASPHPTPAPLIRSDVLVSARSLHEYTDMFGLGPEDLSRRVLDCPGGAASAVAEISADGGTAVAVDPEYALGADELRARVLADLDRSVLYTRERDDQFDWDVRGGVVGHEAVRRAAAERMLADLEAAPERYVAGALPSLPFASDSADLALCSHLLFTYADRLDAADHVAAIVEMARVASEVRIYPLVDHWGTPQPELVRTVIAKLKKERLTSRIEPVAAPFQRAATTRLVVERTGNQPPEARLSPP